MKTPLKILIVNTPIFQLGPAGPVGYSGLEMIAWQRAKGLAQLGHQVAMVAPEGSVCPGVEIISTGPAGRMDEKGAYKLHRDRLRAFDCIVDDSWGKWAYIAKAQGIISCPILGVMHAPVHTMYQTLPPVEKPCMVCISEDQRRHFEALHNRPARTAYNGINTEFYKSLNLIRNERFLFLARFSRIKSPDLAIKACLEAGVGLDLVGDTSITNEPDYLEECKKLCDGKQIRFVGPATRSECVWWFSRNYALLHPVRDFREPLGLAPLESQSCEQIVIAWRNGALPETVVHGETGFLVDSFEELVSAIRRMKEESNLIDRKRCRKWVEENFSIERMVKRYEELCREAVETGGW